MMMDCGLNKMTGIQNLDMWSTLRAMWKDHRQLLTGKKMFVVDDFGRKIVVVDYEGDRCKVHYADMAMANHPPNVKEIPELGDRDIVWFGWAYGAIFTLVTEPQVKHHSLFCWDPDRNNNPFVDARSGLESDFQPHVWSGIHRVAFGGQHLLLLCDHHMKPSTSVTDTMVPTDPDGPMTPEQRFQTFMTNGPVVRVSDEDPTRRTMVLMYSWSMITTMGYVVNYKPTQNTFRFKHQVVDIGCTHHNGSVVLDEKNYLYYWGEISPNLGNKYVDKMGCAELGSEPFVSIAVTSQKILALSEDGQISYIYYGSGADVGPVTMLNTPMPIEAVYAHNTSPVCLLVGRDQVLYLYDGVDLVPMVAGTSLTDAYYLNVMPRTVLMEHIGEEQAEALDQFVASPLGRFNNYLCCSLELQLPNGFTVYLHDRWLIQLLRYDCQAFKDIESDDTVLQSVQKSLGNLSPGAAYVMLFFLHSGKLRLESASVAVVEELLALARELGIGQLKRAVADWDAKMFLEHAQQAVASASGN